MQEQDWLAERFEENRGNLRGVAYRMLGSMNEADDAVQEAWLRLSRSNASEIENLGGWLTTVVSRVCLDLLRSRKSRREQSMETEITEPAAPPTPATDPEREAVMADAVGVALLVVLERLNPAERLAFVLHDLFAVPFEEIGNILGKSVMATRQLASRARRRVQGAPAESESSLSGQRQIIARFLNALRAGDVPGLVAVLDPEFVVRIDKFSTPDRAPREIHGPEVWANQAVVFSKGAKFVQAVLVDGAPGILFAPHGHLTRVLRLTFAGDKIAAVEIIGDPERLKEMDLAVLGE